MTEQYIAKKNNYEKEFKKKWGLISKTIFKRLNTWNQIGNEQGVKC